MIYFTQKILTFENDVTVLMLCNVRSPSQAFDSNKILNLSMLKFSKYGFRNFMLDHYADLFRYVFFASILQAFNMVDFIHSPMLLPSNTKLKSNIMRTYKNFVSATKSKIQRIK